MVTCSDNPGSLKTTELYEEKLHCSHDGYSPSHLGTDRNGSSRSAVHFL